MRSDERQYIHGYDARESQRLQDQARSVMDLLHGDTRYPAGSVVLEVACGTGAQTVSLARNNPGTRFVSFDHSAKSLAEARARVRSENLTNVEFHQADLFALPFAERSFDHLFVCFVLEHLVEPLQALITLGRYLKPDGSITVFEGDHGSAYFHPESASARRAIACQVDLQRRLGGDACIGRQLYPLLVGAGFATPRVWPRMVYVDSSRPHLVESFTKGTFTAMIAGVREQAINVGMIDAATFDAGIWALERTAEDDGVFCYTFFKGVATAVAR
jgi:SAM-dependent methyltransferase